VIFPTIPEWFKIYKIGFNYGTTRLQHSEPIRCRL
jgi:hypothetical protein